MFGMVFPLYDDNPFKLPVPPIVTWGLIAANVLVFIFQIAGSDDVQTAMTIGFGATPAAVLHLDPVARAMQHDGTGGWLPPELTVVTSMFLHSGFGHIFGNMIFLWVFGDDVEEAMGRLRFLAFYLLCGVIAALAYVATAPQSTNPVIGASGAISGVIAAYLMFRPCAKVTVLLFGFVMRIDAFWVIGGWVILQVVQLASSPNDDVAYWSHLGGLMAGAVLFPLMKLPHVELFSCYDADVEVRRDAAPDAR
jgi:membrane associated rhomboid family serine protease